MNSYAMKNDTSHIFIESFGAKQLESIACITGPNRYTPGSMNGLLSDFFREFRRGILGGCSGLFRGNLGRFLVDK